MKKVKKYLIGLGIVVVLVALINWSYVETLLSLISASAMEVMSQDSEASDALKEEMDNLSLKKFIRIPFFGEKEDEDEEVIVNMDEIRPKLKTEPNTAYFWSGKTDGIGGEEVAARIAKERGGVTLGMVIEDQKIILPDWDYKEPLSVDVWGEMSAAFAEQVSGEVHAIIGAELNPNNIWEKIELPTLKKNPNVTKITKIDPKTGEEQIIFER